MRCARQRAAKRFGGAGGRGRSTREDGERVGVEAAEGSRIELHASRAVARVRFSSEARERGAWPRQARAPDITHGFALRDSDERREPRRIIAVLCERGPCSAL
jgi:hypothetical protein